MSVGRVTYYLDTSALLPYYREETASQAIQSFLSSQREPVSLSDLTELEFNSALSRLVRMQEFTEIQAGLVERSFSADERCGLYWQLPVTTQHYRQANKWVSARKTALRTLDALHLACCSGAGLEMITCDELLAEAADILGVPCTIF